MATDNQNDFDEFDNLVEEGQNTDSYDSAPTVKPKKKSSGILIVFLLALVGVAGGAVWFLFLNPGAQSVMAPEQSAEMAAPVAPVTADDALPPGVSPTEMPANPNAAAVTPVIDPNTGMPAPVDAASVDPAVTPPVDAATATTPPVDGMTAEALPPPADSALMPTPETSVTDPNVPTTTTDAAAPVMPPVEEVAPVATEATTDTNMIAAQLPTPTTETAPVEPIAAVAPTEAPADTAAQPAAIAPVDAMPAQVSGQIDAASAERLNKVEQQLQDVSATLAAVQSAAPSTTQSTDPAMNAALQALTEKLDVLSKQVSALEERTTTLATDVQNRPAAMIAPIETNKVETQKEEAAPETIQPVEPKKEAPKKPVVKKAAPKPVNTSGWELRGAQPGVAWLGRVGSGEMSRYSTGQSVPGLGVIQSVTQEGGRWVVKASGGTVRE